MTRLSTAEIDRGILDAAAHTFAQHGYRRTSVQQLADAVGYSKTGLLHRFASKQALHAAAIETTLDAVESVIDVGRARDAGAARSVAILEAVAERALNDPGLVALLVEAARPAAEVPGRDRLHEAVGRLLDMIETDHHDEGASTGRLRAVLALSLIVKAVAVQEVDQLKVDRARLQPLLVSLALGALGVEPVLPPAPQPSLPAPRPC